MSALLTIVKSLIMFGLLKKFDKIKIFCYYLNIEICDGVYPTSRRYASPYVIGSNPILDHSDNCGEVAQW